MINTDTLAGVIFQHLINHPPADNVMKTKIFLFSAKENSATVEPVILNTEETDKVIQSFAKLYEEYKAKECKKEDKDKGKRKVFTNFNFFNSMNGHDGVLAIMHRSQSFLKSSTNLGLLVPININGTCKIDSQTLINGLL